MSFNIAKCRKLVLLQDKDFLNLRHTGRGEPGVHLCASKTITFRFPKAGGKCTANAGREGQHRFTWLIYQPAQEHKLWG